MTAPYTRPAKCKQCGVDFDAPKQRLGWQAYCGRACASEAKRIRAIDKYPSKELIEELYVKRGLSDAEVGRRIGRSYQYIFRVRQHYGIAGHGPGTPAKKLPKKSYQRTSRYKWSLKLKGETDCRNCGRPAVHLHHIVPRSKSRLGHEDFERNGLPLCFDCHRGWHDGAVTIYRAVLTEDEVSFAVEVAGDVWVESRYPYTPSQRLRRHHCIASGGNADADTILPHGCVSRADEAEEEATLARRLVRDELSQKLTIVGTNPEPREEWEIDGRQGLFYLGGAA